MKTTINTNELKAAFAACKKVINPKTTVFAAANYHLQTFGGSLQVTSTDLENFLTFSIPCTGEVDCLLPELDKILSKLDGQTTDITVLEDKIILNSGQDVFTFENLKDTFPNTETNKADYICSLSDLYTELKAQSEFRSKDDLRLKFTGSYFEFKTGSDEGLIITSTDCHKLKTTKIICSPRIEANFILPAKACKLIEQLKISSCDIYKQGKNIIIKSLSSGYLLEFVCNELDETYPDYRGVIPQDNKIKVNISNKALLKAVDKSKVINDIKNSFHFNGCLQLSAENIDTKQTYSTKIETIKTGEDITIGFNPYFLETVLKTLPENINIEMSTNNRAAIFNRSELGLTLLMPVMLEV